MTAILPFQIGYWDWPLQYCAQPVHLFDMNLISLSDTSIDYVSLIHKREGKKSSSFETFPYLCCIKQVCVSECSVHKTFTQCHPVSA